MSLIPGLEGFHMLQSSWACAPQQEKPPQWDTRALQLDNSPHSPQLEKAHVQQQRPKTAKKKLIN